MADDPGEKLELKAFHGTVINDHAAIAREKKGWVDLPLVRELTMKPLKRIIIGSKMR